MNLRTVTLTSPDLQQVVLGQVDLSTGKGLTLTESDFTPAPRVASRFNLPLIAGGVVAPGRIGTRTVKLSGLAVGDTPEDAHEMWRELVEVVRDRGSLSPVKIVYQPEDVQLELEGYLVGSVTGQVYQNANYIEYSLELECADPVAKGDEQTDDIANPIVNAGNADVWPTITVTLSGTVTSLRVGSTSVGSYVQLDGLLGTETTVLIVSQPGFEMVEADSLPALDKLTLASQFFPILPGSNDLYVTVLAGGGSATGTVDWRDGFLL